jgi:hypothetical protein
MDNRDVIFMGLCHRGPSLYDLGGPDDLFADKDNFAVYVIFRLNRAGSMRRVKLYLWAYAIKLVFDHDLGEPDDLFADIHILAVNAVIRLNLMILDHGGERSYNYGFASSRVHHYMTLENLMTSLQT